ncbi:hypothetical protein [Pseudomonas putida]|uniref:hypothetical protein n=1 Tax=Pseudomonas putida TaxID=303 RepID=UPI004046E80B
MSVDAYAGIDPARKRCCAVGEADAHNVMEALRDGLIVVPVSVDTARMIWGSEPVDIYAIALGGSVTPAKVEGLSAQQIERFRQIIQEIATDESLSFDEAFAIASNHLAYWVSEMPKGRQFSGCGSDQAGRSQPDQSLD